MAAVSRPESDDEVESQEIVRNKVKNTADVQRIRLERLMKKHQEGKDIYVPDKRNYKLPGVFNPPEFIRNIWGSSAGAGSGDFHVYRGIRRREYARQKFERIQARNDAADEEHKDRVEKNKKQAEERTAKKRAKRQKKKNMKKNKKAPTKKEESECDSDSDGEKDCQDAEPSDRTEVNGSADAACDVTNGAAEQPTEEATEAPQKTKYRQRRQEESDSEGSDTETPGNNTN